MKELIKIDYSNNNPIISGRELHAFLEVETPYHKWFPRMCEYGFTQGTDYTDKKVHVQSDERNRTYVQADHQLTLEMSKEISMLQRTNKGKQARQYFIAVEKKAREMFSAPKTYVEALEQALKLAKQLEENQPKVIFAETCLKSGDSILVRQLAKIACEEGLKIGQNGLFKILRDWGHLNSNNEPYQAYVEKEYYELIERPIYIQGEQHLRTTTKVLPKGQAYIINRLKKEAV